MKVHRDGGSIQVEVTGPIDETTPLNTIPLAGAKELTLDMTGVTRINSIGVKNWILWTLGVPKGCKVRILNCPFVIVNQANVVAGFVKFGMMIESFRMPYACESCGHEEEKQARRGVEFEYSTQDKPKQFNLVPKGPCPKCGKPEFGPDFFPDKTFKFLT
jgi:hypothetical protein